MDQQAARAVEFESMLLGRHLGLLSRRSGGQLDRSAYTLLNRIRIEGSMSIGELSDALGLDASTLNRQTAAMMRAGLAERIADPDGGIARKFRITPQGERLLDEEREANVKALSRVLQDWTSQDVAEFALALKRFNGDIERLDGHPWPRPQ
ncbi:MarR family winged helix-turn-helix transcriptional regulator [Arthrobacter sp. MMS18-M83]|uniref:MarR family winged helix-turn-helix transcriptional regulator n=1 Tax=Arthrobacter sp. MMS18-M83 TaxID=2996261 RepID=UPI00227C7A90|nr:MarR family transcriptional regulator [Arthrobacter sp. MMS18-M83]WAH97416.1 MarR family transcriptional regulator [Arthrobacter sp. MMS18-M83]